MELDLNKLLDDNPSLSPFLRGDESASRLGGLTNSNWLVQSQDRRYVLRVPGPNTSEYINRQWEKKAALATAAVGINAPVLYFDETSGLQLCEFLDNAETLSASAFKDLGRVYRAAKAMKVVHRESQRFQNRFDLFTMIEQYQAILDSKAGTVPDGFASGYQRLGEIKQALLRHQVPLVPCHCDPLAENFLDTGDRIYIVDWEYSGNNDPMWDLADLAVEAEFSPPQVQALLEAYFTPTEISLFDEGRMVIYQALCDLLWTLWGMIQHANGNPADDFYRYSENRLHRSLNLMNTDTFSKHLARVKKGPQSLKMESSHVLETL